LDLDHGEPIMGGGTVGLPRIGALSSIRWRWVLAAGAGVGIISFLLMYPVVVGYLVVLSLLNQDLESSVQFARMYGTWGMPVTHMLLVGLATSWVSRKVGTAAVAHGVLIALVSVVVGQLLVLYSAPPVVPGEVAKYLVLALGGGLLGGLEGRNVLTGQEALYRASRNISTARGPRAVLAAIEEYLASPAVGGVVLWQAPVQMGDDLPEGSVSPEAWKPWFSQDWPAGVGFDGVDVPALASADGGSPRTLRTGDLPPRERAAWRSRGIWSALLLPLVAPGGARVGLLAVASRGRRRLPRSVMRACMTIEAQAALVLENLRLVEEARRAGRQAGVLRERQRMAHEIHDTLAQGFTSIVMNLQAAEGILPPGLGQAARHHLDQARLTAREGLTEARRLVWALRPEPLEGASLPEALGRLSKRWSEESGIAADITVTGTPRSLSPEIEATLFRTAQEALANVRKHARASRVALTLSYMGDTVALDARDDGVGFDPLQTATEARDRTSGGFGLKGMRERVEQAGGSLSIESAPGEGSTLAVELPMVAPEGGRVPEDGSPRSLPVEPAGRVQ
jgi:signal transduction histidine kinase